LFFSSFNLIKII